MWILPWKKKKKKNRYEPADTDALLPKELTPLTLSKRNETKPIPTV
jgi:hypothetical protein